MIPLQSLIRLYVHMKKTPNVSGYWGYGVYLLLQLVLPYLCNSVTNWMNECMGQCQPPATCPWESLSQREHYLQEIQFQLQLLLSGWAQSTHNDTHILLSIDDWELLQDAEWGSPVPLIVQEDLDEGHHAMVFQDNCRSERQYGARVLEISTP